MARPDGKGTEATCGGCGLVFLRRHPGAKYCCNTCAPRLQPTTFAVCKHCGQTFRPKHHTRIHYCCREHAFAAKAAKPLPYPNCEVCGAPCPRRGMKVCGKACAQAKQKAALEAAKPTHVGRICRNCGMSFSAIYGTRVTLCSEACRMVRNAQSRRLMKQRHGHKYRDRARLAGVEYEPVGAEAVMDRDNWRCQICGRKTPKRYRGTFRDDAPELDHRIPMALGGGHTCGGR